MAPSGRILLAATPINPPRGGNYWAFHLVNDTAEPIESILLESVDYEWGDMGNSTTPKTKFGRVKPGATIEIWQDDDAAAELRLSITLLVRTAAAVRRIISEFGKLYNKEKALRPIPVLGKPGILGDSGDGPPPEPALRAWTLPQGFLVDRGVSKEPVVQPLVDGLPAGPYRELHEFARLDSQGVVREEYGVSVWSIDDELAVCTHAVIERELRELTLRTFYGVRGDERDEKVVATGLKEIPADDAKTRDFLRDALAGHRKLLEDQAQESARRGEARLDAIPGARDDFDLGNGFETAQQVLQERVRRWGEPLDASMLETLARFGRLYKSLGIPLLPAMRSFIIACRHSGFDPSLKEGKSTITVEAERGAFAKRPAAEQAELRSLVERLGTLYQELLQAADVQLLADAHLNSGEFHKAADHVARAKMLLEQGLL